MSKSYKYTLEDAARMGFSRKQVSRMTEKIIRMPNHTEFLIGPVGCNPDQKILFRIKKKRIRNAAGVGKLISYTKYYLFDSLANRQRAYGNTALSLVYGILKLLDNWENTLKAHHDIVSGLKSAD